ncbi:MAG TPA: tetratricopeptide repeat protein [Sphingobacterium sp.]|nr:tetratricopeptide repeat protein [Sphingobacterium sp.]
MKKIFLKKYRSLVRITSSALVLAVFINMGAIAQEKETPSNPDVKAGEEALLKGDFKSAVQHLSEAVKTESSDPDVVYLLGYSQFQTQDYENAISSFEKTIALDESNADAYYYKGKIYNTLSNNQSSDLSPEEREAILGKAIDDYSAAIEIANEDVKLYQNRGLAYRDLGILKGTEGLDYYNKDVAEEAYGKAIKDFEKVLSYDSTRKDIQTELKKATVYKDNLK